MVTLIMELKLTVVRTSNLLWVEDDVQSGHQNEAETESDNTETDEK